jgi:hypothetical protein
MPAMPRPWPEAEALGYESEVFRAAFPYRGHPYHWGDMPDQFALHHVLETIVRPSPRPLFVHYVSVTSHAPFRDVPPYFADWPAAAAPGAFAGPPARSFGIDWLNYASEPEVREAYLAVIEYSLRCVAGFLLQVRRPALAFVLGDHQPPLPPAIAPDRTRHVPIHAISNRPELLPALEGLGFTPGLLPRPEAGAFSTARFLPAFLAAYGTNEAR